MEIGGLRTHIRTVPVPQSLSRHYSMRPQLPPELGPFLGPKKHDMHDMPTCKRIAIEEDRAGIFTDGFAPVAIFSAIGLLVSFLAIYFGAFG
jgi:hypothetical protein